MTADYGFPRRLLVTSLCYVFFATPLASQRPQPFDQQLRDNQQRLESIRRERSDVEQELERLRTQVHSLSDELANIERQKETTNRIVNELDRQIYALSDQIDRTTVDLLLAQNALAEKRAVLERRLVDISKRGALYGYQVLLAAESFGDLLSRYKYLYLVSRQDRLLANDMSKLQRRIGRERQTLVDGRDALGRRKTERTEELDRYLSLERERQTSLRETRRSAREALQRLSELERDEKGLNDRIVALERARRYSLRFALVVIDVDRLRDVNERLGQPAGDRVLAEIGAMMQREIRAPDFVARYGGDEFALVLPETDAQGGRRFVERLRQLLARHTFPDLPRGQVPSLTAGVVAFPHAEVLRPEDLFTQVEAALERGKKSEPDRIGVSGASSAS